MKLSIAITAVVESYAIPSKAFRVTPLPIETSAVHDRMPVIPDPDAYDLWLDPGMMNVRAASEPREISMPG
jgi:hypothetical protein